MCAINAGIALTRVSNSIIQSEQLAASIFCIVNHVIRFGLPRITGLSMK